MSLDVVICPNVSLVCPNTCLKVMSLICPNMPLKVARTAAGRTRGAWRGIVACMDVDPVCVRVCVGMCVTAKALTCTLNR